MPSELGYDGGLSIGLPVRDLDAAIAWYGEVLGFPLVFRMDDVGWAEVATETPGVTIGLSQVEEVKTDGGATVTFGVRDVPSARGQMEARGVRFDGETQVIPGMVVLATFFDPDGNALMLYQDLSGAGG